MSGRANAEHISTGAKIAHTESKVKEFSNSATDVTLAIADLPPQDLALLKAFRVLEMDCPLETMDLPKDHIEVKIGSRP